MKMPTKAECIKYLESNGYEWRIQIKKWFDIKKVDSIMGLDSCSISLAELRRRVRAIKEQEDIPSGI